MVSGTFFSLLLRCYCRFCVAARLHTALGWTAHESSVMERAGQCSKSRQMWVNPMCKAFHGKGAKPPWQSWFLFLIPSQSQTLLSFVLTFPDCNTSSLLLVYEIQNYMLIKRIICLDKLQTRIIV